MEPSLIGWEWGAFCCRSIASSLGPQWSPALSAGNGSLICTASGSASYRNGAQPYRLGMGRTAFRPFKLNEITAMEPSLIGWEWRHHRCGGAKCAGYRNGAQPYRLGMVGVTPRTIMRWQDRNGAQPYRLGMVRDEHGWSLIIHGTAMEPSLIGWEWPLATTYLSTC